MVKFPVLLVAFFSVSILASAQHDEFVYEGFSGSKPNITLTGIAEIAGNGLLRLTNYSNRFMGHAFSSSPFRFKNSSTGAVYSFSTCFGFAIVPEYPKLGGHGLAFAVSPTNNFDSALPSNYLGLLNKKNMGNFSNHLFAVEFDTVTDVPFGDIDDNHVGIDINSMISNKSETAAYFTDGSVKHVLNLKSGNSFLCWIEYDSVSKIVNVTLSPSSSKPSLPLLSYHVDLSPIFKETMFVGLSASTGLLASSHYIHGWSFKMNGVAKDLNLESLPSLPRAPKKKIGLILSISLVSVAVVVSIVAASYYVVRRVRNADIIEPWELEVGPHRYSYQELKKATRGFKDSELLGIGGFGRVYKAVLPNSRIQVAVKRISNESKQGLREFVTEISSIGRLRHRNLVHLLGWCRRRGDLMLVYDFMRNGSLDKFLFDEPKSVLSWKQRFKIVKDVASGMLYLHEGYEKVVIHRDIKASNVLLDDELNGRVGDFGLAKLYEHGSNPNTTRVVGTMGYLAPELGKTGNASKMSDVFAFGALLLEVVCGRRPVDPKALPEAMVLVDLVWKKWEEGRVLDLVDPRLGGEFDENEVLMVLKLGLMCSEDVPSVRPSMRQLVRFLEGEVPMPVVLRPPDGYSYNGNGVERKANDKDIDDTFQPFSRDVDVTSASAPFSLLHSSGEG